MIKGIERGTYERDKGLIKAILTTHNNNLIYGLRKYMLCSFMKIIPFERREHCMRLELIGITYFGPSVLVSTLDFRNHLKKSSFFQPPATRYQLIHQHDIIHIPKQSVSDAFC